MTSILQLQRFGASCIGGFRDACFRICHQTLTFTQQQSTSSPVLVNFGPQQHRISTVNGECFCDQYVVYEAALRITDSVATAEGSNQGGIPFTSVKMSRTANKELSIIWISGSSPPFAEGESCSATYTTTAGPDVLGTSPEYFANWWAILVGVIMFILLLSAIVLYCVFFIRANNDRKRRGRADKTSRRRASRAEEAGPVQDGGAATASPETGVVSPISSSSVKVETSNHGDDRHGTKNTTLNNQAAGSSFVGVVDRLDNDPPPLAVAMAMDDRQMAVV